MKRGNVLLAAFGIVAMVGFSGCAELFAVGHTQTYCEEHCGNYADAGVCATPYDIYQNRHDYAERAAFKNKNCRTCK